MPKEHDDAEITRLAALSPIDYERERETAAQRLGLRVAVLDELVAKARIPSHSTTNRGSGRGLSLSAIEPWPTPVDGAALLNEVANTIRKHVVIDRAAVDAVAMWVLHTYAIDSADVSPRLHVTSAEKRSGKTTLLIMLRALVSKPLATANMTEATLFRVIELGGPTLLIDEIDALGERLEAMRGIINAGHGRGTSMVLRNSPDGKDGWEPKAFDVWGALALAGIGKLAGTIEDRSIKIVMRRRTQDEKVDRLRIDKLGQFEPLARKAARWAKDNESKLSESDPEVPTELNDRAADNWRPLLAISDAAGGEWPERARRATLALTAAGAEDQGDTSGVLLLGDIREMFNAEQSGVLFSTEIVNELCAREDRQWCEYQRGQRITPQQVAKLLKPFGITTNQTVRRGSQTGKGYAAKAFGDVWARYLSPPA